MGEKDNGELSGPLDAKRDFEELYRLAEAWNKRHGHMGLTLTLGSEFGSYIGGTSTRCVCQLAGMIAGIMGRLEQQGQAEKQKLDKLRNGMQN